jgi:hypothetical protein
VKRGAAPPLLFSLDDHRGRLPGRYLAVAVATGRTRIWQRVLPWIVSACSLGYVLGWATDWSQLQAATEGANVPLFVAYTVLDKLIFFLWWGTLQASAVRRFVAPISTRQVIMVRGGAELVRTVNGPMSDAAFIFGMSQLTGGRLPAVIAAAGVPFVCHFTVLLLQASLALPFLDGGIGANRDVATIASLGWAAVLGTWALVRFGPWQRWISSRSLIKWLRNFELKALLPFMGWFALFAVFDVAIQGLASRAFGIEIDWIALAARLPILYTVLAIPSFGNFGTRELTWAASFSDYAPHDHLVAYALATNTLFLILHVVIGVIFLPRAVALISDMRREGSDVRLPILRDASDP